MRVRVVEISVYEVDTDDPGEAAMTVHAYRHDNVLELVEERTEITVEAPAHG